MSYKAMDIAQYVINYSIDIGKPVSNLKLQKLLYYIQAAFLVEKNTPCFADSIENWRHGPVVPEVYQKYKKYLYNDIADRQREYFEIHIDDNYNIRSNCIKFDNEKIEEEDKKLINKVVDSLSKFGPWQLVDKTHEEDPWLSSYRDEAIDNDSIQKYFEKGDNKRRVYGVFS